MKRLLFTLTCVLAACHFNFDDRLASFIGTDLAATCPFGDDPASEPARDACAAKIGDLASLRDASAEPFLWGGQRVAGAYDLSIGTTKFNSRVWRRLYAATFMFGDGSTTEHVGEDVILHVPVTFRHAMGPGAYPYPFWHSSKKWSAYSHATVVHFVIRDGVVRGALRGIDPDPSRPVATSRAWDGQWGSPRVSLFAYALSPGNPFVGRLDHTYRMLAAVMRQEECTACHAPDNRGGAKQLDLLVYPAQALTARHDIVRQLEDDQMPPDNDVGIRAGVADAARGRMIDLARDFAVAGDLALAWEGDAAR